MTPYGYPPLPRPPVGAPDGTGRLPTNLALEFAGHPVFWLDDATKRQRPEEHDDAFAIRLFLELVDRGYLRGGRRLAPQPAGGPRPRRAPGRRPGAAGALPGRGVGSRAVRRGHPPNPDTEPGSIARRAEEVHEEHAAAYDELIAVYRDVVRAALADARDTLREADFAGESQRLVAAGEELRATAAAGDDARRPGPSSTTPTAGCWPAWPSSTTPHGAAGGDRPADQPRRPPGRGLLRRRRPPGARAPAARRWSRTWRPCTTPRPTSYGCGPSCSRLRDAYHEALATGRDTLTRAERILGHELDTA
jgi:hypothetical protein